ncbi:MAG TPA: hypothetical protein VFJ58_24225 [Armatimonadota bacterium]|nr:hypothetical protein [Armatimonadota bacterium]
MRIFLDQGVPDPLRRHLTGHAADTAFERGWSHLKNGALLDAAEQDGYEVMITTDQNLRYQQNLRGRRLAVLVLLSTSWPRIQPRTGEIRDAVNGIDPGSLTEVPI